MLLGDSKSPRSPTARFGAAIGGSVRRPLPEDKEHVLTIEIRRYPEKGWDPKIISMSEGKLKATIAHELEHYLDDSITSGGYNQPSKSLTTMSLSEHFNYLNQQTEIAATTRGLIELAKHSRHPLKDELNHRIAGVRRVVRANPKTDPEDCERELRHYRELLADELVRRSPGLKGKI
jgi:hypothetical protein